MSKVYIRSSKDVMVKELSKARTRSKRKGPATVNDRTVTDWEAIRHELEADKLLATSYDISINDNELIESRTSYTQSRPRPFMENKIASLTGMTLDEELVWACQQGNNLQVKRLADRGADLRANCREAQSSGFQGIHVAALHGHIAVVETLLGYGAMVEEEEALFRWRPLHIAAKSGQCAMVKFLIQKGAQISAKACNGVQPIHEASGSGSVEALDALVKAGAAIDCSDGIGYQPLHFVAQIPNGADAITYLLQKGADIKAKTHEGSRPLQLACASDSANFHTLIAHGARMDYDDGSESALQAAIRLDSKWAVELLLIHGADPNRQNDNGNTILHDLARVGNITSTCTEICQLLLDFGADVNIADNAGDQMLHCLAALSPEKRANTVQLAKLVLDQGAGTDKMNTKGLSPLYLAIQGDNRPLSKLLLRYGARKLKRTIAIRADVRVTTLLDSQAPKYTVNIWRHSSGHEHPWALSTKSFELSIDDEGYFDMVCEALGDDRAARTNKSGWRQMSS